MMPGNEECKAKEAENSDLKKLELDIRRINEQSDGLADFAMEVSEIVRDGKACDTKVDSQKDIIPSTKQNRFMESREVINELRTNMDSVRKHLEDIKKLVD